MVRPLVVSNPKVFLIINAGSNGWVESHVYTSTVPLSDATLQAKALELAKARCRCLDGVHAKLFDCRVSLDDINRDSKHIDISGIVPSPTTGYSALGGPNPATLTAWAFQTVQVSWPVILSTTNATTNPIEYLAGMPASVNQFGSFPTEDLPVTVATYLAKYLTVLINGSWGALGRDWTGIEYLVDAILTIPAAGPTPTRLQFTIEAPHPPANTFPTGAYVRLKRATYTTPQKRLRLNGTYTVMDYDATSGNLTVACPRILVDPVWNATGVVEVAVAGVFPYNDYTFRAITHRKRGRPFGSGRGRR